MRQRDCDYAAAFIAVFVFLLRPQILCRGFTSPFLFVFPVPQLYFQWCTLTDEMVGVNPRIDTQTALSDVCESIWFH